MSLGHLAADELPPCDQDSVGSTWPAVRPEIRRDISVPRVAPAASLRRSLQLFSRRTIVCTGSQATMAQHQFLASELPSSAIPPTECRARGSHRWDCYIQLCRRAFCRSLRTTSLLWKSRSRPLLAPRLAPHRCHTRLILLLDFLPCFPSFPLVTCRRHSSYLAPCATSTRYCAISHRHDSPSATLSSAYIYSPCTYCI